MICHQHPFRLYLLHQKRVSAPALYVVVVISRYIKYVTALHWSTVAAITPKKVDANDREYIQLSRSATVIKATTHTNDNKISATNVVLDAPVNDQ